MTNPGKTELLRLLFSIRGDCETITYNPSYWMEAFDGISNINEKSFGCIAFNGGISYVDFDDIERENVRRNEFLSKPLSAGQMVVNLLRRAALCHPWQSTLTNPQTYIAWINYLKQRGAKVSIAGIQKELDRLQAEQAGVKTKAGIVENLQRDVIAIQKKLADVDKTSNTRALRPTASRAIRLRAEAEKLEKYRRLGAAEIQRLQSRIDVINYSIGRSKTGLHQISKLHQLEKLFRENGIIDTSPSSLKSIAIRTLVENNSTDAIESRFFAEHPIWEQVGLDATNKRYAQLYTDFQNKRGHTGPSFRPF